MKTTIYAVILSLLFLGCHGGKSEKTYIPRAITANEDFNFYQQDKEGKLTVSKFQDLENESNADNEGVFAVKFRDSLVKIQTDKTDKNFIADKFSLAEFVNTQKTALLVQLEDNSGQVAPFYLISVKDNNLEVVSLYRSSKGGNDIKFTKGMIRVGKSGYLINNDFFVTTVNAKVYMIPRQHADERIQGDFFLKSPDRNTFVFLVPNAFYQVHYPTGDVFTQPLSDKVPRETENVYKWVQDNFNWVKNSKGISFFKAANNDKVVDMRRSYR